MNKYIPSFILFSYSISILLIIPICKLVVQYYDLPFYYLFSLSFSVGFLINYLIKTVDNTYNFTNKILKKKSFLFYVLIFLNIENFIRNKKNALFFGVFLGACLIFVYICFVNDISLKFTGFYGLYYLILIYVKLRNTLLNIEFLNIKDFLNWHDFLHFCEIHIPEKFSNTLYSENKLIPFQRKLTFVDFFFNNIFKFIYTNHEFKNLTLLYSYRYNNSFSSIFFQFYENVKKLPLYLIKLMFSFLCTLYSYISYSKFVSSIDGFNGIRSRLLYQIQYLIDVFILFKSHDLKKGVINQSDPISMQVAVKQFQSQSLEILNEKLLLLQALQIQIKNLPLVYFVNSTNKDKLQQIFILLQRFEQDAYNKNTKLEIFLKENHFLSDDIFTNGVESNLNETLE